MKEKTFTQYASNYCLQWSSCSQYECQCYWFSVFPNTEVHHIWQAHCRLVSLN